MKITAQTRPLGLIGHPVSHSKSPLMMNAAIKKQQAPFVYLAYDIVPQQLKQAVQGLRTLQFQGFNVTIPHKVAIMDYMDEIDETAEAIGAVNTVVKRNGKWIGTNTDGLGYLRSLQEEMNLNLTEQRVVIIGAGGAARAIGYVLAKAGVAHITIINRTIYKAEHLATHLSQWSNGIEVRSLADAKVQIKKATCVINTTSVGMHPHVEEMPIDADWLHEDCIVSDLIYTPSRTKLLHAAKDKGARIHNGMGMLLYQAAIAYEHWTGNKAPVATMRAALLET